ncbi:PAS domain-containing protein [Sporosarcina thermotolerans]|uniref:PAS domain-containing protein n=1 Tax=Sporosarcina thermotolerans TaxID=633404 RepID=UPI0024BCEB1A|nr:PAS domain-containing protein [Sporosarcina thermotolerans]WHT48965.1 PAS domain-containing protein [Sporosarcina thermotolerans]
MHDYIEMMQKMTGAGNKQDVEKMLGDIAFALDKSAIVAITDRTGKITYVNELFVKMSKYKSHELIGSTHSMINSGLHSKQFFKDMWATIGRGIYGMVKFGIEQRTEASIGSIRKLYLF